MVAKLKALKAELQRRKHHRYARGRRMASEGCAGLLPIPCCSRELGSVAHLLAARLPVVAERFSPSQSTRPGALGSSHPILLTGGFPSPAFCIPIPSPLRRHSSSVRAVCVNALVRICAGGDQRWSSLPRQLPRTGDAPVATDYSRSTAQRRFTPLLAFVNALCESIQIDPLPENS